MNVTVSVIIPVWHEQETINCTIDHLESLPGIDQAEIIVIDGDCDASTLSSIKSKNIRPEIAKLPGRSLQMNRGAEIAKGEILLFLHADTKLPQNAIEFAIATCADDTYGGGAFDLGFDKKGFPYIMFAWFAKYRNRITRCPYGDQGLFFKKHVFDELGGFADIAILEDLDFMIRLRKKKYKINISPDRVITASRRWQQEGPIRRMFKNWFVLLAYRFGVPPRRLVRLQRYIK